VTTKAAALARLAAVAPTSGRIRDRIGRFARVDVTPELIDALVIARSAGASWADVGRALGIARQNAQHRLAPHLDEQTTVIRTVARKGRRT
jgi:hypothetical protein